MKKTALFTAFAVLFSLFAFAGCVKYSTNIIDTDSEAESEGHLVTETPSTHYEVETDADGNEVTDADGSQVYVAVTEEPVSYYVYDDTTASGSNTATTEKSGTSSKNQSTDSTVASTNQASDSKTDNNSTQSSTQTSGTNEYDIFRSGTFYATGSMKDSDGTTPLEMAITSDSIYMLTKFESVDMAILVSGGDTYLIYPEEKTYLEMSKALMATMGLDADDLVSSGDLGFSDLEPLSQAESVTQTTFNGTACTKYTFASDGTSQSVVYMNGNKLLALETVSGGEAVSTTYITSITGTVPADKINPSSSYEKASVFEFMSLLSGVLE